MSARMERWWWWWWWWWVASEPVMRKKDRSRSDFLVVLFPVPRTVLVPVIHLWKHSLLLAPIFYVNFLRTLCITLAQLKGTSSRWWINKRAFRLGQWVKRTSKKFPFRSQMLEREAWEGKTVPMTFHPSEAHLRRQFSFFILFIATRTKRRRIYIFRGQLWY